MKFDQHLHEILTRQSFDNFTVSDLIDAYKHASNLDATVDRNWAYCQLRRLTEKGLLEKEKESSPSRVVYRKTEIFDISVLEPKVDMDQVTTTLAPITVLDDTFLETIDERAKATKVELLASIGEGEEYKALMREFPSISSSLEEKYQQACQRSTKALGQLRALEAVISEFSS